MTAHSPDRGRQFRSGQPNTGFWARLAAAPFHRALDRIDAGLEQGAIEAWLPDGSYRILGGRGPGPVCEVEVKSWRALVRLSRDGSVGWYQAWAAGEWSSPDPVPLFDLFMRNAVTLGSAARARGLSRWTKRLRHWLRDNSPGRARKNIAFHYDLGNDFYAEWLDETMTYSSALFQEPISADEELAYAQLNKVRALLDRLELKPDQHLLEIGCGWGTLADIAADEYGANVTALTLSEEQREHALDLNRCNVAAGRVRVQLRDYREVREQYDAIASVEMVEAVGQRWWPTYLETIARALKPGGRAAIQYIAIDDALFEDYAASADFIQTYIFPGGMLISESRFRRIVEAAGLAWTDQRDFGLHYAETLKRWRERFDAAASEGRLPAGFDLGFVNLWRYYLMYCEGGFRGGGIRVAQVTLVKGR
ncbi:class I SAM-dependent methyltransferase [Sphingomonas sp. ID1715]|uniref:SAM-dependent methyltransferase n=1 Tax=Sphingomonas sp. ID1715 TaxID=1656898 RepID=UPI0014876168|nr:cyclopropane-fatty-acyl-phospholipid synthase family protein [Sphingomonas sp. ID1715]NNM78626.1 class I SAM-dependent methyltransferase [Sphingomonas sp. ID1715]